MRLKRIIAIFCMISVMLLPASVYAEEKLYEKYGYSEDFKYDNEFIAHVLKASVPKIFLHYSAELRYSPATFDEDAFLNDYIYLNNEYGGQKTQEEIFGVLLQYSKENISEYLTYTGYKTVDTSGSWMGSGVVISEDGYIATNAHVATINDDSRLQLYLNGLQTEIYNDVEDMMYSINEYGITLSEEQIESLYYLILEDAATRATVINEDVRLEVCFPTSDGNTDLASAIVYDAKIVEQGTQEGIEGFTQDTAILKIEADNLIALKLSDSLPETNSTIVSAGYPSASDEAFQMSGSDASVLSLTVGTGQVARLVPIDNTSYRAIEINTTISGGNSGGPSVDEYLNIEGLNTYVHSGDTRYAYMVSAEYVNTLVRQFDVYQGEATKTFLTGIQMLQQGYGDSAEECFKRVKELQGNTPYIENLIENAKKAPDKSYSGEPSENEDAKKGGINMMLVLIICITVGAVAISAVIIVVIVKLSKKNKNSEKQETENPAPQAESVPFENAGYTDINNTYNPAYYPNPPQSMPEFKSEEQKPVLRSTMRKSVKVDTPPPKYTPSEQQALETTEPNGSRLIRSDNLKKDE